MKRRSLILPWLLILFGLLFLLETSGVVEKAFARFWPVLLIVAGIVRLTQSEKIH